MTTPDPPGKPASTTSRPATVPAARHVYGPRPIGALVPGLTRAAFRQRSPAGAQIMADWAAIIGPALAAVTVPRRLSGGTLTLACAGPVALELQHLAGQVLERINAHMGKRVVERLRFVQDGAAPRPTPPPQPPPVPVAVDLPGIPPGPLHDALHALAQRIGNDKGA